MQMPLQAQDPGLEPPTLQPLDEGCGCLPIKELTSASTAALRIAFYFL